MKEYYDILYYIHSYPIIFTLDPNAVSSTIKQQYPRLVQSEIQYTPSYKSLSLSDLGEVRLNPAMEEFRVSGIYKEQFAIPVIASAVNTDNSQKTHAVRQRNFEEQVLRSPTDPSRYRRIFQNIGIHVVIPETNTLDLEPFMVVNNGVSSEPLIIRNMVSRSFRSFIFRVSDLILRFLFQPGSESGGGGSSPSTDPETVPDLDWRFDATTLTGNQLG